MKKLYIETYGCQMNVADSEVVASVMQMAGYETTENLDEANAEGVMELFRDLNREGMTVLVVTHNPSWTQVPGARVWRMERGRVAEG